MHLVTNTKVSIVLLLSVEYRYYPWMCEGVSILVFKGGIKFLSWTLGFKRYIDTWSCCINNCDIDISNGVITAHINSL